MYAVVDAGGRQYRVMVGQQIEVERLSVPEGETVELERVLMVVNDEGVKVGQPTVAGAKVVAQVVGHYRGEKIMVFKYKSKTRYRRRAGHRQAQTRLAILGINLAAEDIANGT